VYFPLFYLPIPHDGILQEQEHWHILPTQLTKLSFRIGS